MAPWLLWPQPSSSQDLRESHLEEAEVLSLPPYFAEEGREAVGGHQCQVLAPMPELEPGVLEAAG